MNISILIGGVPRRFDKDSKWRGEVIFRNWIHLVQGQRGGPFQSHFSRWYSRMCWSSWGSFPQQRKMPEVRYRQINSCLSKLLEQECFFLLFHQYVWHIFIRRVVVLAIVSNNCRLISLLLVCADSAEKMEVKRKRTLNLFEQFRVEL